MVLGMSVLDVSAAGLDLILFPRYPLLIDAVVRSGALGFVTADDSLTSVLATRRVSSWQGGIAKRVLWETKLRQELRPGMKP